MMSWLCLAFGTALLPFTLLQTTIAAAAWLAPLLLLRFTPLTEIRAILVDPRGEVRWDYLKTSTPLGDGNIPGPGVLPTVDTPYLRLSTAICFGASFPGLIRQAGRAGVDILLVPSSDWEQATGALAEQATLRAVENGVAWSGQRAAASPWPSTTKVASCPGTQLVYRRSPNHRTDDDRVGSHAWRAHAVRPVVRRCALLAVARRTDRRGSVFIRFRRRPRRDFPTGDRNDLSPEASPTR